MVATVAERVRSLSPHQAEAGKLTGPGKPAAKQAANAQIDATQARELAFSEQRGKPTGTGKAAAAGKPTTAHHSAALGNKLHAEDQIHPQAGTSAVGGKKKREKSSPTPNPR
jgi:hypothetical protein